MDGIGKSLAWTLLAAFGLYVAIKYYRVQVTVSKAAQNIVTAPAGINYYCNAPVTQRFEQTQSYNSMNPCMTTIPGFSAAFGPQENQPQNVAYLEI